MWQFSTEKCHPLQYIMRICFRSNKSPQKVWKAGYRGNRGDMEKKNDSNDQPGYKLTEIVNKKSLRNRGKFSLASRSF